MRGGEKAYKTFISCQEEGSCLHYDSFTKLHEDLTRFLTSSWKGLKREELLRLFEVAAVLGDVGKSSLARKKLSHFMEHVPEDHDEFFAEMLRALGKHPSLLPSYSLLSPAAKRILLAYFPVHLGHGTHLEGAPMQMYALLKKSAVIANDPLTLDFAMWDHLFNVAAAVWHVRPNGSLSLTQDCYQRIQDLYHSLQLFSEKSTLEKDVVDVYLHKVALRLGLIADDSAERMLTRFACMLRFYTKEEAAMLKTAFTHLPKEKKRILLEEFSPDKERSYKTPTYVPALLINAYQNKANGQEKQKRLDHIFLHILPLVAEILEDYRKKIAKGALSLDDPLCFNPLAGSVKGATDFSKKVDWMIDQSMQVVLQD